MSADQQELFSADAPKQPFTLSGWAARHEQPTETQALEASLYRATDQLAEQGHMLCELRQRALDPEEAAIVRQALSYALARRSAGCPYAPEWTDGQVVQVVGPLVGRLPR